MRLQLLLEAPPYAAGNDPHPFCRVPDGSYGPSGLTRRATASFHS
jgi:hypothetical protein